MGFYFSAKWKFVESEAEKVQLKMEIEEYLRKCDHWISQSEYSGLAELTNSNGSFCKDSCATQAWSMSKIAEVAEIWEKLPVSNK
jgi:glycogen debranching enzyme